MSGGRRPSFRLTYKSKDGTKADVGVCWESERFPGLFSVKPEKVTNLTDKWPKMRLSEAAARCEAGDGFLDLAAPKNAATAPQKPATGPSASDFDDVPFAPFVQD